MYGIAVVDGCPPPYFSVYRLRGMFSVKLSRSFTLKLWSILPNQVIAGSLIGLKRLRQPMWPMEVGASRSWFGQFCVGVRVGYFDMYAFAMGPAPSLMAAISAGVGACTESSPPRSRVTLSMPKEKNVLSLKIGPSISPPNWFRMYFGLGLPCRFWKKSDALSERLRLNS